MKIETRFKNGGNTNEIKEYVERRLWFSLNRFSSRIDSIQVRLSDVNGPRGGLDQQCSILIKLKEGPRFKIESLEADCKASVDLAADRIGRLIGRHFESQRAFRFQSGMVSREWSDLS